MADPNGLMAFYPQIKWVHICRGQRQRFAVRAARRAGAGRAAAMGDGGAGAIASYTIDTVLLTAALMLLTILPGAMFANGWLTTKLSWS